MELHQLPRYMKEKTSTPTTGIDPLMCFARSPTQTPDEVFVMFQERMMTLLGYAYATHGFCLTNWTPFSDASKSEIEAIMDWHHFTMGMTCKDFDRLGEKVDLSMKDVLGRPILTSAQYIGIQHQFGPFDQKEGMFDPVLAAVALMAMDRIDDIARHYAAMAETQKQ